MIKSEVIHKYVVVPDNYRKESGKWRVENNSGQNQIDNLDNEQIANSIALSMNHAYIEGRISSISDLRDFLDTNGTRGLY